MLTIPAFPSLLAPLKPSVARVVNSDYLNPLLNLKGAQVPRLDHLFPVETDEGAATQSFER